MKVYKLLRDVRKKIRREFLNEKVESVHQNNSEVTLEKINERMMKVEELCLEVNHKLQGDDMKIYIQVYGSIFIIPLVAILSVLL